MVAKHKHVSGKSETFAKDFVNKVHQSKQIDPETDAQAHDEIAAAIRAGNAVCVMVRTGDMDESSDGSGDPAQLWVTEYKFPNGKPAKTVNPAS